jgi:hypothetical protein
MNRTHTLLAAFTCSLLALVACEAPTDSLAPADTDISLRGRITSSTAKLDVCHLNGTGEYVLIAIAEPAWETHQAHGDGAVGIDFDSNCQPLTRILYYIDRDGDGFGNRETGTTSPLEGYVTDGSDCNDGNETVYPGAIEQQDGVDNDCDGLTDDILWYGDQDGDGYGNDALTVETIKGEIPVNDGFTYVLIGSDCNDADKSIHPGAEEIEGDRVDNDCDGQVDELPELVTK